MSAWPLPMMALAQVWVADLLASPLDEPIAHWTSGYAVLAGISGLAGLGLLALAAHNCFRLVRTKPCEASWTLVGAVGLAALVSALVAAGPMTVSEWHWKSLIPAALATYLLLVLVRETNRVLNRGNEPTEPVGPR